MSGPFRFGGKWKGTEPAPKAPQFTPGKPWQVNSIRRDGNKVIIQIRDSANVSGVIEFAADRLKLIQYIGTYNEPTKKLYAEVRSAPRRLFVQPPHKIVYLGDVDKRQFEQLERDLRTGGIDVAWYQTPRKEKVDDLLPKEWSPSVA